jgi:large subunit ribosomal protein L9
MAVKLLLLSDVDDLGRSGDVVNVKPGFARNFLLPQQLAVLAHKGALRMQDKLREERQKKALTDKTEAEGIATKLGQITLSLSVKVDQEGHMYGSVAIGDILKGLHDQHQIELEKRSIQLKHPIKSTGLHEIPIKLKEAVMASITLKVIPEQANGELPPMQGEEAKLE